MSDDEFWQAAYLMALLASNPDPKKAADNAVRDIKRAIPNEPEPPKARTPRARKKK